MKQNNKAQSGTLRRVLAYIRPYGWLVVFSLLLAALTVALTLYFPILVGDAVDHVVAPGQVEFAAVAACGFSPSVRGEQLTLEDFNRLSRAISAQNR